jgi:predicted TIM-barrel fold metal-dependent hydrolase
MNLTSPKVCIDTHFHVFIAGDGRAHARYVPQYTASLADWMAQAGAAGVTKGVLVQPSFLGHDNSLMLRALRAHPDALRGVAVVAADADLRQLQPLHASGVRGIRLNLSGLDHRIEAWSRAQVLWDAMFELGWHLEVHTDRGGLPTVLAQLPSQMPLVIDHMGKPERADARDPSIAALVQRARHTPTHVKLSGAYRLGGLDPSLLAPIWLHELGVANLLWGSDWPCTNHETLANYPQLRASLAEWISPEHLAPVLSCNPQHLYWGSLAEGGLRLGEDM